MGLRDRMYELTEIADVEEFMKNFPTGVFFKAGTCHKTMEGFGQVERALDPWENIHMGYVKVVEFRPVSNYIAELTKVVHQSPQLILMVNQKPVYDVDNWNIKTEVVSAALKKFLGNPSDQPKESTKNASLQSSGTEKYIELLEKFLKNDLSEEQFESQWLHTFQRDASLRPEEEVAILESLFGDVDAALADRVDGIVKLHEGNLVSKAEFVLKSLKKK